MSEPDAWSQLVSLTDLDAPEIPISKDKFIIGRDPKGCDLSFAGNKLVSGKHCYIDRDGDGKVWLYDTSTNGTLLNLKIKVTKGECRQLNHGDEIYIVYKKDEPDKNIGYMFQDKSILDQCVDSDSEDEVTQDYAAEPDQTLADALVNDVPSPTEDSDKKRKSEDDADMEKKEEPPEKCQKLEEESKTKPSENDKKEKASKPQEPEDSALMESLVCIICQELLHDCISLQPCMHSFCAGCYSEWMEQSKECPSCRTNVERINKNHLVNNLVEAFLKDKPGFRRPEEDLKELDAKNKITRDMLYPGNSSKRDGSASEYSDEEDNSDGGNGSGSGSDDGPVPLNNNFLNPNMGVLFGVGTPLFGAIRPPTIVCRQCPGFQNTPGAAAVAITAGLQQPTGGATCASTSGATNAQPADPNQPAPGPSTSGTASQDDPDAKVLPDNPPPYTCIPFQNHVLCLCCMQPMPDRRLQFRLNNDVPPQQCTLCFRSFCHAYWGCLKVDCMGCLGSFREMNFGKKCLAGIILDNAYESEIFKNYLEDQGLSVKQVLADCITKVNAREYTFQNQIRFAQGIDTVVCYTCGLQAFKELAYQYRLDIPRDRLPADVLSRPNCYWGKNCRTQRNKPEHAKRFNHICDQTRTM